MPIYNSHSQRPRYFDRQQLRAADLTLEQDYQSNRHRQLNRHLHGWGVACGGFLNWQSGWHASLSEGFAISPLGHSVVIPAVPDLDLWALLDRSECGDHPNTDCSAAIPATGTPPPVRPTEHPIYGTPPPPELRTVHLVARPTQLLGQPRVGIPEDCGHPGNHLQPSRVCDAVCLQIVCDLPPLHRHAPINCNLLRQLFCPTTGQASAATLLQAIQACPEPVDATLDYLVLADIRLAIASGTRTPSIIGVDYHTRRLLLPSQTLQDYLRCLCTPPQPSPSPTATATVTSTPTVTNTPTFTATQTVTLTRTLIPSATFTLGPTGTFILVDPSIAIPTRMPTATGLDILSPVTRPREDWIAIDALVYDPVRGQNTPIDQLAGLSAAHLNQLHELQIHSMVDLYQADTSALAGALGVSEVRIAEYKDNALNNMRRAEAIHLDPNEFDLTTGMSTAVEAVHNIGHTRSEQLRAQGMSSVADIANSNTSTLSRVLSVSERQAADIILDAQNRMRRL